MKKSILLSLLFLFGLSISCSTNEVVQAPLNQNTESLVFEISNTNFQSSNSFSRLFVFPRAILPSDHVLVYRLSGVTSRNQDIWSILPQQFFLANGAFDFGYNFDFTKFDVNIFLQGNDLAGLSSGFRLNQVFRIVIIQGQFGNKINSSNINEVMNAMKITEEMVVKM